jgi:coproporphyrinogen III oxidase
MILHIMPEFKVWADNYFFIKHREETRGIGGIFFDRMNEESRGKSKEQLFDFVLDVGKTFAPIYTLSLCMICSMYL